MGEIEINNIKDLDLYVEQNGTGVRREGDIYKPYNQNIYQRIAAFLFIKKQYYLNKSCAKKWYGSLRRSPEEILVDITINVLGDYDPERGKTFNQYFISRLSDAYKDENKKNYIKINGERIRVHEEPLTKGDDEDDDIEIADSSLPNNDRMLILQNNLERICDVLYDILQVVVKQKRTKGEIFRLFYTDTIINALKALGCGYDGWLKHEKPIFDNLEKGLISYVFVNDIETLKEIIYTGLHTTGQLIDLFADQDEKLNKKYSSIWGERDIQYYNETVRLPLSNAVFLAYIFIREYERSNGEDIPEPHDPAYISNYSGPYKELIASFYTPEIKEMMG